MASAVLLAGLIALFIMAAISAWLTWSQVRQAVDSRIASDLRFGSIALLSVVQEAHIAQNAYVAHGDPDSLDTLDRSWQDIDGKMMELRGLIAEDSQHGAALRTIETLLRQRMQVYQILKNGGERVVADDASLFEISRQLKQINAIETNEVLQAREEVALSRNWLMAGTTATALIASLLCFGAYTMIRRRLYLLEASERVLSAFNAELETSVRQRTAELELAKSEVEREKARAEALLSDVNHRVGNSLQIVSSLVNMHAGRVTSSEAREILASVRSNVHAIASAQRRIRLTGASDRVELANLLGNLIEDIKKALPGSEQVTIALDAQEAIVSSNDAVSISVIVMEAINNAIKYASSGNAPVAIRVALVSDRDKQPSTVSVDDDGVGFDDHTATPGLGSEVTEALASSLRARLSRTHVNPKAQRRGTRVTLDFRPEAVAAS